MTSIEIKKIGGYSIHLDEGTDSKFGLSYFLIGAVGFSIICIIMVAVTPIRTSYSDGLAIALCLLGVVSSALCGVFNKPYPCYNVILHPNIKIKRIIKISLDADQLAVNKAVKELTKEIESKIAAIEIAAIEECKKSELEIIALRCKSNG